ncbi:MAG: asparagine synthase (glutamine-hydrolyzing) [Bacteroidia bacterium]|nr:asparagine synthase (glutamine-hydrolyzing) [Bacteroidia bacterium]
MLREERFKGILSYFSSNFPEPKTELNYRNTYELLVAVILSAQCTDKRVNMVTPALFEQFPDPFLLAEATVEQVFEYIRSVSFPNNKSKHLVGMAKMLVHKYQGEIPATVEALRELPGVGRKTANVIASVIFNQPTMAVDTHVFRVSKRLGLVNQSAKTPLEVEKGLVRYIPQTLIPKAHHWLILHGRYICVARKPKCTECPITAFCRYFEKNMRGFSLIMCGIHLILDKKGVLDEQPIQRMVTATHHRGPDHRGFYTYQHPRYQLFFGHNRLKILDLSEQANQPLRQAENRFVLLYNGEIYNYLSLEKAPSQNAPSPSDTVALMNWLVSQFAHAGPKKIAQTAWPLNGMYAFIFWDARQQNLLIARDPLGIKPLYYYQDDRYFILSSEPRGILASGLVLKKLNNQQVIHYLHYGFGHKAASFYENILAIEGIHSLRIEDLLVSSYNFSDNKGLPSFETAKNKIESSSSDGLLSQVESLLLESVRRHLRTDVPLGIFLSGGIDSTLMLALCQEAGLTQIPTFTVVSSGQADSFGTQDAHYARLAARQFGGTPHELVLAPAQLHELDAWISVTDRPMGDGAAWLSYLLAQQASRHVRVILSGSGADELFAGYHRHVAYQRYLNNGYLRHYAHYFRPFRFLLYDGQNHPWRKTFRQLKKFLGQLTTSPQQTFINFTRLYPNPLVRQLSLAEDLPHTLGSYDELLDFALRRDQAHYLRANLLPINDLMGMAHSLEIRVPYLDRALVELMQTTPAAQLLSRGPKWVLKALLEKRGGHPFVRRPKEGFGLPLGKWLRAPDLRYRLNDLLNPEHGLYHWVEHQRVKTLVRQHLRGQQDFSLTLWALVVLDIWLEQEFG